MLPAFVPRRSASARRTSLAFVLLLAIVSAHAALAIAPDTPSNGHSPPVLPPTWQQQQQPPVVSHGDELQTPQQAYERALALLRSTIKSKPAIVNWKSSSAATAKSNAGNDGAAQQQKQKQPQQQLRHKLLSSTSLAASKGRGPPIGATRDELRWHGARPLPLWPDWETLGPGLAPINAEESPWDSVMFGPFHAGWDSDDQEDITTSSSSSSSSSFLQDVTQGRAGFARPAPSLWQHPVVPSLLGRWFRPRSGGSEDGSSGNSSSTFKWWFRVEAPWSQAKRQRREALRLEMEQRRSEAIGLLEWAAWGRRDVDWQHEAYAADKTADVLANMFHYTDSVSARHSTSVNASSSSDSKPRVQAHADALWVLAEHSLWGTHGALPDIARARACYQRLVDFGHDAAGFSKAGNASAHARLAFLEGSGWESTIRRQWLPPPASELVTIESSMDQDELHDAWQNRRDAFARLKRDDGLRQAKALLHYTRAAEAGDAPSQMALGFRYRAGIGARPVCYQALAWYESAAKDAYRRFQTGPPGGLTVPYSKLRLSDLAGGVYGPGASAASTGLAARKPAVQAALNRQPGTANDPHGLEDMLEYHIYHAERGDARFMLLLARVYYQGSIWAPSDAAGAVRRDYKKAMNYLLRITRKVWPKDAALVGRGGPTGWLAKAGEKGEDVQLKVDDQLSQAGSAASLIGRMYLRGEGVRQDFACAWVWFNRGADTGDGDAYNGLGMMLRDGLGVRVDIGRAVQYFEAAAKERSLEGTINLAKVHIDLEDYTAAIKSLDLAIRASNSFEAYFLMATVNARLARSQNSVERCRLAVAGFKQTVERGDWAVPVFHRAERAWRRRKKHKALLGWALAGELGFEAAQNNVAYILDRDKRRLQIPSLDRRSGGGPDNSTDRLALIHWTRSAGQDNVDAMVKMGDYYFHGIGTRHPGRAAYDKAAACYAAAADRQVSALAYWNMGWLYEKGLGVARRDFHLAKRYYDMAVEVNEEAYLPVTLSLIKLHLRALWAAVWRSDAFDTALSLFSSYTSPTDPGEAAYTEADEMAQRARKQRMEEKRDGYLDDADADDAAVVDAGGSSEQGDGWGDPNNPETWRSKTGRGGGAAGEEGLDDEEELEELLEGGLLVLALGALAYLAYVRQGVQMRVQRERRQQLQPVRGENEDERDGEGEERHRQFPWAPGGGRANVVAGL